LSSDNHVRIDRRPGERYAQCHIQPIVNFGGGSVMVWAHTVIHMMIRGTVNVDRYIRDILETYDVVPFVPFIGDEFVLMHDNAKPHVANVLRTDLNQVNVATMNWSTRSPDFNPIEYLRMG
jgi:hypothetical protein